MEKIKFSILFLFISTLIFAQKSPRKQITGTIGSATVTIDWGAPSVKNRTIWGGLESYGKVWRAGANKNTTISIDKKVKIGENVVPPGTYGFFIIPNQNTDWIVILSRKNDSWGAFSYKKEEDLLRLSVKPIFTDKNQEVLDYKVTSNGIIFSWEKVRINILMESF